MISIASYTTLLLTALLQVVIARLLGAEQFGMYATAFAGWVTYALYELRITRCLATRTRYAGVRAIKTGTGN